MRRSHNCVVALIAGLTCIGCVEIFGFEQIERVSATGGAAATGGGGSSQGGSSQGGASGGMGMTGGAGGTTGTAGGPTGGAGGSGNLLSPDWSTEMTLVYEFDNDLSDASGNGFNLSGSPMFDTVEHEQGVASLALTMNGLFVMNEPGFSALPRMTFGGWVRVSDTQPGSPPHFVFGKYQATPEMSGYAVMYTAAGDLTCRLAESDMATDADATPLPVPSLVWVHVVCRVNGATIFSFGDGAPTNGPLGQSNGPTGIAFQIVGSAFHGHLDEVFVKWDALDDVSIKRIYACGIDGRRCICNATSPTQYDDCGRLNAPCNAGELPPCNQAAPAYLP